MNSSLVSREVIARSPSSLPFAAIATIRWSHRRTTRASGIDDGELRLTWPSVFL